MTALHSFFASLQGEHIEKLDSWTGNIIGEPMSNTCEINCDCDEGDGCDYCEVGCDCDACDCDTAVRRFYFGQRAWVAI